jgi:hypothetical protein
MGQQVSIYYEYNTSVLQLFIFAEGHEISNKLWKTARFAVFSLLLVWRPSHPTHLLMVVPGSRELA